MKILLDDAFPDGDADGHRRYHQAQIIALENRAEFWKKMQYEITKWGLIGFIGWFVVTVLAPAFLAIAKRALT